MLVDRMVGRMDEQKVGMRAALKAVQTGGQLVVQKVDHWAAWLAAQKVHLKVQL
jgi:hypothetical protein